MENYGKRDKENSILTVKDIGNKLKEIKDSIASIGNISGGSGGETHNTGSSTPTEQALDILKQIAQGKTTFNIGERVTDEDMILSSVPNEYKFFTIIKNKIVDKNLYNSVLNSEDLGKINIENKTGNLLKLNNNSFILDSVELVIEESDERANAFLISKPYVVLYTYIKDNRDSPTIAIMKSSKKKSLRISSISFDGTVYPYISGGHYGTFSRINFDTFESENNKIYLGTLCSNLDEIKQAIKDFATFHYVVSYKEEINKKLDNLYINLG